MAHNSLPQDAVSTKWLVAGFLEAVSALLALCAKHASRLSRKGRTEPGSSKIVPRLSRARPKRLLTSISNKTLPFLHKKKMEEEELEADVGYGDGGVWQRAILMGDKCQPLDFSGVIYYDSNGKQLSELPPRSPAPRASPLPSYATPL